MHEFKIAQKVIEIIETKAKHNAIAKVKVARLRIGRMAAFQKEQLEFCLSSFGKNDALEGVKFEIDEVPVGIQCKVCGHCFTDEHFNDAEFAHTIAHAPGLYSPPPCPSCSSEKGTIISGEEIELISIEGE